MDLFRRLFSQTNSNVEGIPMETTDKQNDETAPIEPVNSPFPETTSVATTPVAENNFVIADGATRPLPPKQLFRRAMNISRSVKPQM